MQTNTVQAAPPVDPAHCLAALRELPVAILSDNLMRLSGCVGLQSLGPSGLQALRSRCARAPATTC
jgi:hypothetical protein